MKTNEIINQFSGLELDISRLDHSDFRELHGLSEEDVANIKQELLNQVAANRAAAEEKINFVLALDPVADQEKLKAIMSQNIKASVSIDVDSLSKEEEAKLLEIGVPEELLEHKKEKRTQEEIKTWYNSLDKKEKERYAGVIKVIDNEKELKIN